LLENKFEFVGLQNYILFFSNFVSLFNILKNTLIWTFGSTLTVFGFGMLVALLLYDPKIRFKKVFRSIFIIPWSFSMVGIMTWRWLFSTDYGMFNEILRSMKLINEYIPWLESTQYSIWATIIFNIWHMFPYAMVMILAGLESIPTTLYEAAELDGASGMKKFFYITLPQLKATLAVSSSLYMIWTLNTIVPYVLVPGSGTTEVLATYIYKTFFLSFNFGLGSAAATLLFVLTLLITIFYLKMLKLEW
jgi:multiple sugar transport system permease protein